MDLHVLLVDDDEQARRALANALEGEGVSVHEADSAAQALALLDSQPFDLLVLALSLPGGDAIGLVERARDSNQVLTIMMVCERSDERDVARALDAGADEYVIKPVSPVSLSARVRALARRSGASKSTKLSANGLELDERRHCVSGELGTAKLTTKELMLLRLLIGRPRRVRTRAELLADVWGYNFDPQTSVLDVAMHRLRAKIRKVTSHFEIESRRGAGFELVAARPTRGESPGDSFSDDRPQHPSS
jgi:DNA-binding response OmpR family regulator